MIKNKKFEIFWMAIFLLLLCGVTYGDLLTHQFMDDDHQYIKSSISIFSFYRHLGDFFIKSPDQHYAPFHYLINVGLFQLFQKPLPLYLINLFLFYINCVLIFVFVYFISNELIVALLTSIIFVIHPMTGEVLLHITRSSILVQNIFLEAGLIFLCLYAKYHGPVFYYFLSLLMVFLALFCQEIALLFPLYAIALLFFLTELEFGRIIKIILPFILIDVVFIAVWFLIANPRAHLESINIFHSGFFWGTCANFSHIFFWYLGNLFVPRNIVYMCFMPPLTGFIWLWNSFLFGFLTGYVLFIFRYFRKSLESFALALFLTSFIYAFIASQVWFKSRGAWMFDPTWIHFSSVGFYLFIVLIILRIRKHIQKWLYITLLLTILMSYSYATLNANVIARTEVGYSENWLRKFPGNMIAMNLVANFYRNNESIPIPLDLVPAMFDMLDFYIEYGYSQQALQLMKSLSSSNISLSQRKELFYRLTAYHCKNVYDDQCEVGIRRIIRSQKDPYVYMQLSDTFDKVGDSKTAATLLKQCITLYPRYKEPYLLIGVILANEGHYKESINFWKQGLLIDHADQRFISNIDRVKDLIHKERPLN